MVTYHVFNDYDSPYGLWEKMPVVLKFFFS